MAVFGRARPRFQAPMDQLTWLYLCDLASDLEATAALPPDKAKSDVALVAEHLRELKPPMAPPDIEDTRWDDPAGQAQARIEAQTVIPPGMDRNGQECDCGCNEPIGTCPRSVLTFLSGRFKYAGVSHAVGRDYARDIDRLLAKMDAAVAKGSNPVPAGDPDAGTTETG